MKKRVVIFRFNMVEVALALVILAIGLASVMVLFPVGLKASRSSMADNNVGDVAERVGAYLQAKYTSSDNWNDAGEFKNADDIKTFDADPGDGSIPKADDFTVNSKVAGMDGLFELKNSTGTYYLYRQYSNVAAENEDEDKRAVDFEAMIRVGWDTETLKDQYYTLAEAPAATPGNVWKPLRDYTFSSSDGNKLTGLDKCYRTLIIEISWPADAPWSKREKRVFRMEMFNENFVPYPQSSGSGGSGGSGGGSGS